MGGSSALAEEPPTLSFPCFPINIAPTASFKNSLQMQEACSSPSSLLLQQALRMRCRCKMLASFPFGCSYSRRSVCQAGAKCLLLSLSVAPTAGVMNDLQAQDACFSPSSLHLHQAFSMSCRCKMLALSPPPCFYIRHSK